MACESDVLLPQYKFSIILRPSKHYSSAFVNEAAVS